MTIEISPTCSSAPTYTRAAVNLYSSTINRICIIIINVNIQGANFSVIFCCIPDEAISPPVECRSYIPTPVFITSWIINVCVNRFPGYPTPIPELIDLVIIAVHYIYCSRDKCCSCCSGSQIGMHTTCTDVPMIDTNRLVVMSMGLECHYI